MPRMARDGGLLMPEAWPRLTPDEIAALAGLDYADAAYRIMRPFLEGDPCLPDLEAVLEEAYGSFHHPAVAPLRQIAPNELPARAVSRADARLQGPRHAGGGAADEPRAHAQGRACHGDRRDLGRHRRRGHRGVSRPRGDRHLHPAPEGPRQRRAAPADDDGDRAQRAQYRAGRDLRRLPGDRESVVRRRRACATALALTGINSINFARILAQIPYYFTAARHPRRALPAVAFSVPTGNFGDIFAGYAARAMGLPVARLVIATNLNDSLPRALGSGIYEPNRRDRHLQPEHGHPACEQFRAASVRACRPRCRPGEGADGGAPQDGSVPSRTRPNLPSLRALFAAHSIGEHETEMTIRWLAEETGVIADPHTAVAVAAARQESGQGQRRWSCSSTAHPAKFPEASRARHRPRARAARALAAQARPARALHHARPTTMPPSPISSRAAPAPSAKRPARVAPRRGQRVSVERSELANGLDRDQPCDGRGRDRLARHLGRRRQPKRSARRAWRRAFPRAYGLQGHRAAQRSATSPRRSRRSAASSTPRPGSTRPPITRACCARTSRSRSIF